MFSGNIYEFAERWEEKPLIVQILAHLVLCPFATLGLTFVCGVFWARCKIILLAMKWRESGQANI